MKGKYVTCVVLVSVMCAFLFAVDSYAQDKQVPETVVLKLEGAKMAPVNFSHKVHVEKAKTDCVVCHHKDKDPKAPEGCVKCHELKVVKNGASVAKDAFHKQCMGCHKEAAGKGVKAPTKCNECHKK